MALIEAILDTSFFSVFFYYAISNASYCINTIDMPSKELLDFRADLSQLLIHRSRYKKRPVVPQSSSHSRNGVASGCSLCRVREVGISRGKCCH